MHEYQKRSSAPNFAAVQAYQRKIAAQQASSNGGGQEEEPLPKINRDLMYKAYQARLLQLFPSQQVQQEKESDSSSSASTADVAQTTLGEPHLHGMMMSNLMQIQAAGQQTDTEATLTQADAKTEKLGQDVQAKGDWQEKADTNTVGSESIQLKCASCAAGDSVQVPESELQQHDSNGSATEVQLAGKGEKASESQIQQVAATGFSGSSTSLPHLNQIQQSFGVDLSGVQAYIGGEAAAACQQMGAAAYASGDRIAFNSQPSLELAAHEAAHVVQQASGKVQLAGGVGQVGDEYENHADAVAAKVGAGESAAPLLADFTGSKTSRHPEILSQRQPPTNQDSTESHKNQTTVDRLKEAKRLSNLGFLEAEEGDYQAALKFYEAALKLAPNNSIIWYNRGVVFIDLNRLQLALDSTQTALAINGWGAAPPSMAWNNIGVILSRLGRFNEALPYYKKALALNPSYKIALTNLRKVEAKLSANPSLRNQSQQTPPESGKNFLQTLFGALQGAFNEDQTGEEVIVDFLIGLIPIIGQVADARDLAAYLYRIVFKGQVGEVWNWIGLALTLVGIVPVVGDTAKFLGKISVRKGVSELTENLGDVLNRIRIFNPKLADNIPQLKAVLAQNWHKGTRAALDRWNTVLSQLSNWANSIPDLLFSGQKQQLIKAIRQVESESDKMLSQAFEEIRQKIDEALDAIGRLINPNGEPITPDGMPVPNADRSPSEPLRIETGEGTGSTGNPGAGNTGSEAPVPGSRQRPTETVPPVVAARQWAAQQLQIPPEILEDLSVEAIERLKRLPRWARDRFSQLNHGAMRRILECSSPCKVDLQEVESYLRNLAADAAVAGAKRLMTPEDVIKALPQNLMDLGRLQTELQKPRLMNIIMQAELTDLDFAKISDFITRDLTKNADDSYYTFTGYLTALIPSKFGPNINRFIEYADANVSERATSALRGPMFENFVKLYIPELRGLDRAGFNVPKYKKAAVNVDAFDPTTGTIWEFKYQANKLAGAQANKYVTILGEYTVDGKYQAKRVNFVFATEEQAQLNKGNLKKLANHHIFFVSQSGESIRLIEL